MTFKYKKLIDRLEHQKTIKPELDQFKKYQLNSNG